MSCCLSLCSLYSRFCCVLYRVFCCHRTIARRILTYSNILRVCEEIVRCSRIDKVADWEEIIKTKLTPNWPIDEKHTLAISRNATRRAATCTRNHLQAFACESESPATWVGFRALCLRFRARPARNCPKLFLQIYIVKKILFQLKLTN